MLTPHVQDQIRQLIDPEFDHRSDTLIDAIKAKLHRLVADRGQGGHLTVEISALIASELRARIQQWAIMINRVFRANGLPSSASAIADFSIELQKYATRDHDSVIATTNSKYAWLTLELTKIKFATTNELIKQIASAAIPPGDENSQNSTGVLNVSVQGSKNIVQIGDSNSAQVATSISYADRELIAQSIVEIVEWLTQRKENGTQEVREIAVQAKQAIEKDSPNLPLLHALLLGLVSNVQAWADAPAAVQNLAEVLRRLGWM